MNQDEIYNELDMPHRQQQAYDDADADAENQQRPESQNGELWKKFGRGNDVGNMLFSMYGTK